MWSAFFPRTMQFLKCDSVAFNVPTEEQRVPFDTTAPDSHPALPSLQTQLLNEQTAPGHAFLEDVVNCFSHGLHRPLAKPCGIIAVYHTIDAKCTPPSHPVSTSAAASSRPTVTSWALRDAWSAAIAFGSTTKDSCTRHQPSQSFTRHTCPLAFRTCRRAAPLEFLNSIAL